MAVITSEDELKNIFKSIFESKSMQAAINILDTNSRRYLCEIEIFFKNLSNEDFQQSIQMEYNGEDGLTYLINSLREISISNSQNSKHTKISTEINSLYKLFDLLYPKSKFNHARRLASDEAKKKEKERNIELEEKAKRIKLGDDLVRSMQTDTEFLQLLAKIYKNRTQIQKLIEEMNYISKRLGEAKNQLINSEKEFVNESKNLTEKLKEGNVTYINNLHSFVDANSNQIKSEIDEQHENVEELSASIAELQTRLNAIDNGVYREELATYFLREHDNLKGKIDPIRIFIYVLVALLVTNRFEFTYYWYLGQSTTIFLRLLIFLISFSGLAILGYIHKNPEDRKEYKETILGILTPYWCWLFATLCGMGLILHMALRVCTRFEYEIPTYNRLLPYVSIYLILIWFTWFASKQFSYTKQICDEYEYKYALAKSYMNYKNEAVSVIVEKEGNPILLTLLDSVIKNIAHSPVQSVKQDVHTPFSEVFKTVKEAFPKKNQ